MQKGYEGGGLDKAIEVLSAPECSMCFAGAYTMGSGKYEERLPGMLSDWGRLFHGGFPAAAEGVA